MKNRNNNNNQKDTDYQEMMENFTTPPPKGEVVFLKPTQIVTDQQDMLSGTIDTLNFGMLQASIEKHGIQNPIAVWNDNGIYRILDGVQRLEAARILNLEYVPAIKVSVNDAKEAMVNRLNRNLFNRTHIEPLRLSNYLFHLKTVGGYKSSAGLGKDICLERSKIDKLLRLQDLDERVKASAMSPLKLKIDKDVNGQAQSSELPHYTADQLYRVVKAQGKKNKEGLFEPTRLNEAIKLFNSFYDEGDPRIIKLDVAATDPEPGSKESRPPANKKALWVKQEMPAVSLANGTCIAITGQYHKKHEAASSEEEALKRPITLVVPFHISDETMDKALAAVKEVLEESMGASRATDIIDTDTGGVENAPSVQASELATASV